jgi:hypothetical protein
VPITTGNAPKALAGVAGKPAVKALVSSRPIKRKSAVKPEAQHNHGGCAYHDGSICAHR